MPGNAWNVVAADVMPIHAALQAVTRAGGHWSPPKHRGPALSIHWSITSQSVSSPMRTSVNSPAGRTLCPHDGQNASESGSSIRTCVPQPPHVAWTGHQLSGQMHVSRNALASNGALTSPPACTHRQHGATANRSQYTRCGVAVGRHRAAPCHSEPQQSCAGPPQWLALLPNCGQPIRAGCSPATFPVHSSRYPPLLRRISV